MVVMIKLWHDGNKLPGTPFQENKLKNQNDPHFDVFCYPTLHF